MYVSSSQRLVLQEFRFRKHSTPRRRRVSAGTEEVDDGSEIDMLIITHTPFSKTNSVANTSPMMMLTTAPSPMKNIFDCDESTPFATGFITYV